MTYLEEQLSQPITINCPDTPDLDLSVTIPVLNEEECLARNVRTVVAFLQEIPGLRYEVVIADNGSTDATFSIAKELTCQFSQVHVIHIDARGRGRALKAAWGSSSARVLSYMDADLSTDLALFPAMIESLLARNCDIAVASRLLHPASTQRGLKREIVSRVYAGIVRHLFRSGFSDPQCGFKALRREVAERLLPMIADDGWFFDTELLVLAERDGWRILDFPAPWVERRETRVQLLPTIAADLKGLYFLRRKLRRMREWRSSTVQK